MKGYCSEIAYELMKLIFPEGVSSFTIKAEESYKVFLVGTTLHALWRACATKPEDNFRRN